MEQIKFLDIHLCEHENKIRETTMHMGPIGKILGPWFHHFIDYYACKNCMLNVNEVIKKYNPHN